MLQPENMNLIKSLKWQTIHAVCNVSVTRILTLLAVHLTWPYTGGIDVLLESINLLVYEVVFG